MFEILLWGGEIFFAIVCFANFYSLTYHATYTKSDNSQGIFVLLTRKFDLTMLRYLVNF